jgi:hypothetical protein
MLVLVFVVVPEILAQRTILPVGSTEAVKAFVDREVNSLVVSVGTNNPNGAFRSVAAVPVRVSRGGVTEDVGLALPDLLRALIRKVSNPDRSYVIQVDAGATDPRGPSYTGSRIVWVGKQFRMVRGSDGGWSFPAEAFNPTIEEFYSSEHTLLGTSAFIGVYAPDVRWVQRRVDFLDGSPPFGEVTRNGFAADCPSGKPISEGGFLGNGFVYFMGQTLAGTQAAREVGPGGIETVTLWYDEGRTIGDEWVTTTGEWRPVGYLTTKISPAGGGWMKVEVFGCEPDQFYTLTARSEVAGPVSQIFTARAFSSRFQFVVPSGTTSQFFRVRPATLDEIPTATKKGP